MRLLVLCATTVCAIAVHGDAHAEAGAKRLEIGAALGYAAPVGSAEQGARLSDTTTGLVRFHVDAGYRLTSALGAALAAAYAPAIPTLCRTASDCVASFGYDIAVSLRARAFLPPLGPTAPRIDFGVGYEWLTTKLSDGGATSTHSVHGPLLVVLEAVVPFRIGSRWSFGAVFGGMAGVFTDESLEAAGVQQSSSVRGRSAHAWLTLGLRAGFELL